MTQIEDLTLIKLLGKGAFGEVYLSQKKNSNKFFATKRISREIADRPQLQKYLLNELEILKSLDHPYIVKLEETKKSKNYYYIVMEYINGGGLSECLHKYMKEHNKPFNEEIVQYLMKQIIEALDYIHEKNIIHRDLKLDNIMVNFDNEWDKDNFNMMKAKIKIIDFGFAVSLKKDNLASTAVGSPINMDPIILEKYKGIRDKSDSYDTKADIWSVGTVCYELLIGKAVFDAETLDDLVEKVKKGIYHVPSTLSREVISFLNHMLVYDSKRRLSAKELLNHPFITKNVKDFLNIKTNKVSSEKKIKQMKNKSIWAIFNEEEKFIDINENQKENENYKKDIDLSKAPIPGESEKHKFHHHKSEGNNNYNKNKVNELKKQYKRPNTIGGFNPYPYYVQPMIPNFQNNPITPPPMINQYSQYNLNPYQFQTFGVPLQYNYNYNQYLNYYPQGNYNYI